MSEPIKDGGTAFPCEGGHDSGLYASTGMSLRDYLAAKAMEGLLSGLMSSIENIRVIEALCKQRGFTDEYAVATTAYQYADAMIAARETR